MIQAETLFAKDLAHEVLQHLAAEHDHLQRVIQRLDQIHDVLRRGELQTLFDGQVAMEQVSEQASSPNPADAAILAARESLRAKLAQFLPPADPNITIENFAQSLPGQLKRSVLAARHGVAELTKRIERRSRQNGMIILHSLRIMQDALESASGTAQHTPVYGHAGMTSTKVAHARFEMKI